MEQERKFSSLGISGVRYLKGIFLQGNYLMEKLEVNLIPVGWQIRQRLTDRVVIK